SRSPRPALLPYTPLFRAPVRGAGRQHAVFVMEQIMEEIARRLDLDPAEVRRRNLIGPSEMPYRLGLMGRHGREMVYDSGNYPERSEEHTSELQSREKLVC